MKSRKFNPLFKFGTRYLCSLEKEHLFKLKEWRNAQMKVLRQYTPLTDFHQKRWAAHLKEDKSQVLFGLVVRGRKRLSFVGYCGITNIDLKNRRGEISFLVDPARTKRERVFQRDFFAVLNMLCKYGFEELNLNKLFTETFEFRRGILKTLKEFGFSKEGELREQYFGGGKYFNSVIHSILSSEWKKTS